MSYNKISGNRYGMIFTDILNNGFLTIDDIDGNSQNYIYFVGQNEKGELTTLNVLLASPL